ncbi:VanZ family protein [Vibrio salinus]|uniref:VanZ family protein n=1 Tax=Vibrio salinus TaxID=2899784 RepID=UPI001E4366A5|nr:VanZ family protein [Vibrio salinus]MCE0493308.1 VanZ family protein [Vibrio salinus]
MIIAGQKVKQGHVYFLLILLFIAALSIMKSLEIRTTDILIVECYVGGDKHLHFYLAFILGFTSMVSSYRKIWGLFTIRFISLIWVFGTDELIQCFFQSRKPSLMDFLVDCFGMVCSFILYQILFQLSERRKNN